MGKHEKAPQVIGVPQFAELAACVLKQLPRDIDPNIAQGWIMNPKALSKALQNALCPPPPSVLERVRASGYLDTSFGGREVHLLPIYSFTKEQAFVQYRRSGEKALIWHKLENNMPYAVPKAEMLDVMILDFGRVITDDEALCEMDNLGVCPLVYEHLIQYGIVYPEHQKQKALIGLGTRYTLDGKLCAPSLKTFFENERHLDATECGGYWDVRWRFLVVPR
jgi:hypothetical protein